jgi:hypothetical protein
LKQIISAIFDILTTDIANLPSKLHQSKEQDDKELKRHPHLGVVGIATHQGPRRINEDQICAGSSWGINYVVLADGLGGYHHAGDAARIAVRTFRDRIELIGRNNRTIQYEDIREIYAKVTFEIQKHTSVNNGWKTTIICVIERPRDILVTYLGDGQVYLVRGDSEAAISLAIGHRVNGRLGGVIGPEMTAEPVIMRISKSFRSGEIIVAGTDGVFNHDVTNAKPSLLKELVTYIQMNISREKPNEILARFLYQLYSQDLLDDNASLGLVVTGKAREYISKRRKA